MTFIAEILLETFTVLYTAGIAVAISFLIRELFGFKTDAYSRIFAAVFPFLLVSTAVYFTFEQFYSPDVVGRRAANPLIAPFIFYYEWQTSWKIFCANYQVILGMLVSGGFFFARPIKKILTQPVLDAHLKQVRKEMGPVVIKAKQDFENRKAELEEYYRKVQSDLERRESALNSETALLTTRQEELDRQKEIQDNREAKLKSNEKRVRAELILAEDLARSLLAGSKNRKGPADRKDANNADPSKTDGTESELRDQIEALSRTNQQLKGMNGRISPYHDAWTALFNESDDDIKSRMNSLLESARQKRKNANGGSKRRPKPSAGATKPAGQDYAE